MRARDVRNYYIESPSLRHLLFWGEIQKNKQEKINQNADSSYGLEDGVTDGKGEVQSEVEEAV